MRPSRFLVGMFVSLAVLPFLAGSSAGQGVGDAYSLTGTDSSAYPAYVMPVQGRDARSTKAWPHLSLNST